MIANFAIIAKIWHIENRCIIVKIWAESLILVQIDVFATPACEYAWDTFSFAPNQFVFVCLNKNLGLCVFKIKTVQSHKIAKNSQRFHFEFKF